MFLLKLVSFFIGGVFRFGLLCYVSITVAESSGGVPLEYLNEVKSLTIGQVVELVEVQVEEVSDIIAKEAELQAQRSNS